MKKLVYLFELDSVRKTDKEIFQGQNVLYDEIVGNGNTVVLTYNQLVDSRAFFSLLVDETYRNCLIKLFEKGLIRISQYGDNRTISKYLIDSLAYERHFIYSGWPLKSTQKRLLALIKRSLVYSDLTEITDYLESRKDESELLDLFIEVDSDGKLNPTSLNPEQCKAILENLSHLLVTVLRLSFINTIYVNPKPRDGSIAMTLPKFLRKAMLLKVPTSDKLWSKAIEIIQNLKKSDSKDTLFDFEKAAGSMDRSDYHHAIKKLYEQTMKSKPETDKRPYQYAEAIVDLCYNYQLEYSICNSSKHYNVSELASDNVEDLPTFGADFLLRLKETWDMGDFDNRFLLDETNVFNNFGKSSDGKDTLERAKIIQNFSRADRILTANKEHKVNSGDDLIHRYEHDIDAQRTSQKNSIEAFIGKNLVSVALGVVIMYGLELLSNFLQDISPVRLNFFFKTLIFWLLAEFITDRLSSKTSWVLSLSDALKITLKSIADFYNACFHKVKTHRNDNAVDVTEQKKKGLRIDFIMTDSLKKYIALWESRPQAFAEPDKNPRLLKEIKGSERNKILKESLRLEELFGYHFGVVYQSKFNTLIVDPTLNESTDATEKNYKPFERIVPTGKNGTVLVTMHNGKFVLLKQFRHAPRKEQFAFPRGFNESNLASLDNAEKELDEELSSAPVGKPVMIGRISPDSGLSSTCADVYLINVDDYKHSDDEGIIDTIELDEKEFDELLERKNASAFDDGFTLAAFTIYKNYKAKMASV